MVTKIITRMKRIIKVAFISLMICSIPIILVKGQEKKNDQHIKIVVVDDSGKSTVLDTLFKDGSLPDSIMLKGGKVICIGKHDGITQIMSHSKGQNCKMSIDINSEKGSKDKVIKRVIVTTGDSLTAQNDKGVNEVIVMKKGKHYVEGKGADVMYWSSDEEGNERGNVIYINEDNDKLKDSEKVYNIEVKTDDSGQKIEKTKYILAKDGMVISIEGNDEAKVKDLVKDIESKMGVNKSGTTPKPVLKDDMKKTNKK